MKKIIFSVATGFLLWTVLWCSANFVVPTVVPDAFTAAGTISSTPVLLFFLGWSMLASFLSGAMVGRRNPGTALPNWVLGFALLLVGSGVQASYWDAMPVWFHLGFLAALLPVTLFGGRFASGDR
ncbi:MAG: hypothetical protein AAF721_06420 [Myxococcota bacterium]